MNAAEHGDTLTADFKKRSSKSLVKTFKFTIPLIAVEVKIIGILCKQTSCFLKINYMTVVLF